MSNQARFLSLKMQAATLPYDASKQAVKDLIAETSRLSDPAAAEVLEVLSLRLLEIIHVRNRNPV